MTISLLKADDPLTIMMMMLMLMMMMMMMMMITIVSNVMFAALYSRQMVTTITLLILNRDFVPGKVL